MTGLIAGVELGGTKCVSVLADPTGRIVAQESIATRGPEETLADIDAVLARWWSAEPFGALGIASFGPLDLDPTSGSFGQVTKTPKPGWSGMDVLGRLSKPYDVPVGFDTDVNGAALAEMRWGAGVGTDDFAYITVGTGVGVGLIVHGQPTRGFAHCELGHIRVARSDGDIWPGCCPFHGDCVEGLVSGTAIKARLAMTRIHEVADDDPVWDLIAHTLAQLCHVILCAAAPRRIVIGGGVANGRPRLLERIETMLRTSLAGYMPIPDDGPYVTPPGLGALAGPLGPIALALATPRAHEGDGGVSEAQDRPNAMPVSR